MAIIKVNSTDRTPILKVKGLTIEKRLQRPSRGKVQTVETDLSYTPKIGHQVDVFDENDVRLMAGLITEIDTEVPEPGRYRKYTFDLVSLEVLAEKRAITEAWGNVSGDQVVKDVISQVLSEEGVTEGTIRTAPTIDVLEANVSKCGSVLDDVAGQTGFQWTINPDRSLDFHKRDLNLAPWDLNSSTFDRFLQGSLKVRDSRAQYRNRQYVKGVQGVISERAEAFTPSSPTRSFELDFPIEDINSITVNGTDETDEQITMFQNLPLIGDVTGSKWIWDPGSKRLEANQARASLTSGDTLTVNYDGRGRGVVVAEDQDAINARDSVESGSGIWINIEDRQFDDPARGIDYARGMLRRFGDLQAVAEYKTYRKDLDVGMVQQVDLPEHNLPSEELAIVSLRITDRARSDGKLLRTIGLDSYEAHNPVAKDVGGEERSGDEDTNNQAVFTPPNPSTSLQNESGADDSPNEEDSSLDASGVTTPTVPDTNQRVWIYRNNGAGADTIELLDPSINVVDSFTVTNFSGVTGSERGNALAVLDPGPSGNKELCMFNGSSLTRYDVSDPSNVTHIGNETLGSFSSGLDMSRVTNTAVTELHIQAVARDGDIFVMNVDDELSTSGSENTANLVVDKIEPSNGWNVVNGAFSRDVVLNAGYFSDPADEETGAIVAAQSIYHNYYDFGVGDLARQDWGGATAQGKWNTVFTSNTGFPWGGCVTTSGHGWLVDPGSGGGLNVYNGFGSSTDGGNVDAKYTESGSEVFPDGITPDEEYTSS